MIRRPGVLGILALLGACDIVDETGYLCGDGTRVTDPSMCADVGWSVEDTELDDAADVDSDAAPEGARGDLIQWTAPTPPGDAPVTITVIGLPGAIPDGSVVTLQNVDREVDAVEAGTTFTGAVEAAAGDTVTILIDGDEAVASLAITAERFAGLDTEAEPPPAAFPEDDAGLLPGDADSGFVAVGDGALALAAPYVVYNTTTGVVVSVVAGDTTATIAAAVGDELCVSAWDGALLGPPACEIVAG